MSKVFCQKAKSFDRYSIIMGIKTFLITLFLKIFLRQRKMQFWRPCLKKHFCQNTGNFSLKHRKWLKKCKFFFIFLQKSLPNTLNEDFSTQLKSSWQKVGFFRSKSKNDWKKTTWSDKSFPSICFQWHVASSFDDNAERLSTKGRNLFNQCQKKTKKEDFK